MELDELKTRLKISLSDTSQDAFLSVALEDAIDYTKTFCRQDFLDENGNMVLPSGVKQSITKLVKAYQENSNVASQSLGDMSKSFFEGGTMNEVHRLLKPYRKVRFL
ncbi:phage head-tail connector protein [Fictibacillus gelatini]|uniref:phage head-tail connector protein n=1 Tax=Fictibacillus gelatini TaxID=225985 RepID=UPI0004262368|nr:phage head-tail connector protein [Fictibacillus gelatini]